MPNPTPTAAAVPRRDALYANRHVVGTAVAANNFSDLTLGSFENCFAFCSTQRLLEVKSRPRNALASCLLPRVLASAAIVADVIVHTVNVATFLRNQDGYFETMNL